VKKQDLFIYIKNGVTLDRDLQPIKKNNGFMCSIMGYEKTFNYDDIINNDSLEIIYNDILEYKKILKKDQFIGLWYNDGLIYLDISRHYKNKQDAIKNGVKNKQLAIYDLKNNCDIYLTKKVYIIYKYNKIKNDIIFINEYTSIKELENATKKKRDTLKHYMIKSIDDPIKELLFNKYLIVIDNAFIKDLES